MTLPWARHLWREKLSEDARLQLGALNASAIGSAAKYGGKAGRAAAKYSKKLARASGVRD
jgi:hypothetical protein